MKEYKGTIEISPKNKRIIETGVVVYSNDIDSFKFTNSLVDENGQDYELTNVSDTFVTLFFGGMNIKNYPKATLIGELDKSQVSFTVPKMFLGFVGTVYCEINLSYESGRSLTAGCFKFKMTRSLIDEGAETIDIIYVEKFEDIKKNVQEKANLIDKLIEDAKKNVENINEIDLINYATKDDIKDFVNESDLIELESELNLVSNKLNDSNKVYDSAVKAIYKDLENKPNNDALVGIRDWLQKQIDENRASINELRNEINKLKN